MALLLPLAWVVEVNSCNGEPGTTRVRTGVELVSEFDPAWQVGLLAALAVAVVLPALAGRWGRGSAALGHLVGLAASGLVVWAGWMTLFFTIFSERTVKAAGWLVVGCLALFGLDAAARTVLAAQEAWREIMQRGNGKS
jgi:hypothetical protein